MQFLYFTIFLSALSLFLFITPLPQNLTDVVSTQSVPVEWHQGTGHDDTTTSISGHTKTMQMPQSIGFSPEVILDVGANVGDWSRSAWTVFQSSRPRILMIEGTTERIAALAATSFEYVISVVGSSTREVRFFTHESSHTGNSVYQEANPWFDHIEPRRVLMRTIDDLLEAAPGHPIPQLLKLDIQGYELEALRGAAGTLKKTEIVFLETSVLNYNKGAPLITEVLSFMHSVGFDVIEIIEIARLKDFLLQVDIAFANRDSSWLQTLNKQTGLG